VARVSMGVFCNVPSSRLYRHKHTQTYTHNFGNWLCFRHESNTETMKTVLMGSLISIRGYWLYPSSWLPDWCILYFHRWWKRSRQKGCKTQITL